jgi:hypothetical protein
MPLDLQRGPFQRCRAPDRQATGGPFLALPASAVLRDSAIAAVPAQFAVIQVAAPSLGVELRLVDMRNVEEVDAPLRLSRGVRMTPT